MKKCISCTTSNSIRWYRQEKYNKSSGNLCNRCYSKRAHQNEDKEYEIKYRKEYNSRPSVIKRRNEWQRNHVSKPEIRLYRAKHKAKSRNLEFLLTLDQYSFLVKQPCYYCQKPISPYGGGLDRVDNNAGYTLINSVACCKLCNVMKRDLTQKDFYSHTQKIVEVLLQRTSRTV